VYIREGTQLHKSTNNLMNSLGIEVIEVSDAQELPQQATHMFFSFPNIVAYCIVDFSGDSTISCGPDYILRIKRLPFPVAYQ